MPFNSNFLLIVFLCSTGLLAQVEIPASFEVSASLPFGKVNPEAPEQLQDYAPLIGLSDCQSERRKADNSWAGPTDMTWRFKYIMNGMAIQDETLKEDGVSSGSIRQYSKDSARWYVHYYTTASISAVLSSWEGNKKANDIVLYRKQKAPNGMEGFYRLTFYEISKNSFKWIGEWVDPTEKIVFPTWKISCIKREE